MAFVDVAVMAAGKGTRMKSSMPKVLHRLGGRALVQHVIDTARSLKARNTIVITGHGSDQVEPALLAANAADLGKIVAKAIDPVIGQYGLTLPELYVENVSLPPAVEAALDKRTSLGIVGDLGRYAQFSAAEAMTSAAANPAGGGMAAGLGAGMGLAMAQQGPWGAMPAAAPATPPATAANPAGNNYNFVPVPRQKEVAEKDLKPEPGEVIAKYDYELSQAITFLKSRPAGARASAN